jgi:hypothetical protein
MGDRSLEPSGDPGHAPANDIWAPPEMPDELRRLGLTRNTEEGAWVEFASMLDPRRPTHVAVAWLVLLTLFGIPAVVTLVGVARG